jgi:hypothetical protein
MSFGFTTLRSDRPINDFPSPRGTFTHSPQFIRGWSLWEIFTHISYTKYNIHKPIQLIMEKLKQTIAAASLIGEYGITLNDGRTVYAAIQPLLIQGNVINLDFQDVTIFASPFFNAAIGRLFSEFDSDYLNEHLHFNNLPSAGEGTLRQVLKNAKDYYTSEVTREAVDRVLHEVSIA